MRFLSYTAGACIRKLKVKLRRAIELDQQAMVTNSRSARQALIDEAIALKVGARTDMRN